MESVKDDDDLILIPKQQHSNEQYTRTEIILKPIEWLQAYISCGMLSRFFLLIKDIYQNADHVEDTGHFETNTFWL